MFESVRPRFEGDVYDAERKDIALALVRAKDARALLQELDRLRAENERLMQALQRVER